jgi:hypothetical protein
MAKSSYGQLPIWLYHKIDPKFLIKKNIVDDAFHHKV